MKTKPIILAVTPSLQTLPAWAGAPQRLTASPPVGEAYFGAAVAVSGDYAVVGGSGYSSMRSAARVASTACAPSRCRENTMP